jgi:hypothetical protein
MVGECLEVSAPIPDTARNEVFVREATLAIASNDFASFATMLKDGRTTCYPDDFSGKDTTATFKAAQMRVLTKTLSHALKACGSKRGAASADISSELAQVVYEIALVGVTAMDGDETVVSSLQLLSRVAKPESMTEIELDGVAVDLKRLRECATLAFHSVYVTWGSNIFDRCDQFKIAHSRDQALFSQWEITETELMLMVGSEELSEDGELHLAALSEDHRRALAEGRHRVELDSVRRFGAFEDEARQELYRGRRALL